MAVRLHVRASGAAESGAEAVFELDQTRISIGRGAGADVRLPARTVSARHATIELVSGARYAIVDHESTNGTSVSGARVVAGRAKPLAEGDRIEIGGFLLSFKSGVAATCSMSRERTSALARRLVRDVSAESDLLTPRVVVVRGPQAGSALEVGRNELPFVIGSRVDCAIVVEHPGVAAEHAELVAGADCVLLRDLGSRNGTFVGGRHVDERLLDDGDEVQIGATVLRFVDPAAERVARSAEGEDEVYVAPVVVAQPIAPSPVPALDDAASDLVFAPEPVTVRPSRAHAARAVQTMPAVDAVIYLFAAVLLTASVVGLTWLLRAS